MVHLLKKTTGFHIPKRYIITFLGFFGMFNVYAMRVNLSVAIVAMIKDTHSDNLTNDTDETMDYAVFPEEQENFTYEGKHYDWDPETKGLVISAFFVGYMITQMPGGYMAEKCGFKWVFGAGIFVTSVLTLLTPISVRMGSCVLIAIRFLEGLAEGVTYPTVNFMVSQWSPLLERSRVSAIVFMGAQTGNVVAMPLSGWLCSSDVFGGWPAAFYVFGLIGAIWFLLWVFFVYESPYEHPTISVKELAYFQQYGEKEIRKKPPIPWKHVFSSPPMWATLVAHYAHNFGLVLYLTELPSYLDSVFHFDITQVGVYSALPFIMQVLVACLGSSIADKLRSSGRFSITSIRKIMNSIGFISPAICLLCVTISGYRSQLVIGLLTAALALNGLAYSGFHVTHLDMSPDFSGTLFGLSNISNGIWGVIIPNIVGVLSIDGDIIGGWNKMFYFASALYVICGIFYFLFASAEPQPWGKGFEEKEEIKEIAMIEISTICSMVD